MRNRLKQSLTVLLAVLMLVGLVMPGALAAEPDTIEPLSLPFTDVRDNAWYRPYVQAVRDQGIMNGTSSTRFSPAGTFSRGQIIATLFRIHHNRTANANDSRNNPFNDVGDAWYTPYVTWAHNNGISSGTSATRFGANDHLTRQEIATIMHNYVRNLTDHDSGSTANAEWNAFTDRGQITFPGAYNAFRWANNNGIVNGVTSTRLEPNGTATRAQAAAMLVRLVDFMSGGHNNNQPQIWTVSFDLNGGTGHFPDQQVRHGERVTRPADPIRTGWVFNGWFLDGRWSHNFANDTVRENMVLVAMWSTPTTQLTPAQAEAEFVRLINQHRALYGLRPLIPHAGLADVARAHSTDMRTRNFFAHFCLDGISHRERVWNNHALNTELTNYFDLNNTGNMVFSAGEVLSGTTAPRPEQALRSLLNSPPHRGALMNPNGYFIGVGFDGPCTVKLIAPTAHSPIFIPGVSSPPNTHPFNPQP